MQTPAPVTHHNGVICHQLDCLQPMPSSAIVMGNQRSGCALYRADLSVAHPFCGKVVDAGNWDWVHEPQCCGRPACQRVLGDNGNMHLTCWCFACTCATHRHTDRTCQYTFACHSLDMNKDMIYGCLTWFWHAG